MSPISRRQFISTTAAAVAIAGRRPLLASPYGWPIGFQIFPLAKMIDTDFRGTMKQVADAGFQTIELLSPWYNKHNFGLADMEKYSGKEIQSILGDLGLKAIGAHVDMTECRGEELPKIIQWAKDRGLNQICVPSLDGPTQPPNNTLDTVKKLADEYNHAGEMSAKAGLKQGLHTEGFELSMIEGKRVFDHLFGYLDKRYVRFQFQMSTINSGLVAADYFTQHPGWFLSMHLQDVDMNTEVPGKRGPSHPPKAIGQGTIDWKKTFQAAKIGGVENFFVEQGLELAKAGVPFLKQLTV